MLLESRDGPHVIDTLLDSLVEREGFVRSGDEYHHLLGVHNSADTDGQRLFRHLLDVVAEESRVGLERVLGQSLDARPRGQRRARFVERYVTVRSDTTDEQLDSAGLLYLLLKGVALQNEILRVAVEYVHVLRIYVYVLEEIVVHVVVVGLRMVPRKIHVLVHVERFHVSERYLSSLVVLYQLLVHSQGRTSCKQIYIWIGTLYFLHI